SARLRFRRTAGAAGRSGRARPAAAAVGGTPSVAGCAAGRWGNWRVGPACRRSPWARGRLYVVASVAPIGLSLKAALKQFSAILPMVYRRVSAQGTPLLLGA